MNEPLISFCAGTFDGPLGCHEGHRFLISEMRKLVGSEGKVLIGLNSDQYLRDYKNREPLSNWAKRADALYDTGLVDEVFGFYCNPIDLIMRFKPNYLCVGSDYNISRIIGAQEIKQWGGEICIITRIPNISTSAIIQKLNENKSRNPIN